MRFLWPAATLVLLVVVAAFIYFRRIDGCDVMEPGGTLYLRHAEVDTIRGRFCYASDCRLIAELMSELERAEVAIQGVRKRRGLAKDRRSGS